MLNRNETFESRISDLSPWSPYRCPPFHPCPRSSLKNHDKLTYISNTLRNNCPRLCKFDSRQKKKRRILTAYRWNFPVASIVPHHFLESTMRVPPVESKKKSRSKRVVTLKNQRWTKPRGITRRELLFRSSSSFLFFFLSSSREN